MATQAIADAEKVLDVLAYTSAERRSWGARLRAAVEEGIPLLDRTRG